MEGAVATIVRKPDGEVVPMLRTTPVLTVFLGQHAFLSADFPRWWPGFAELWLQMRADYERHQVDGRFMLPGTRAHFPCDTLAPRDSGLVVVDFVHHTVVHAQSACVLGAAQLSDVVNWDDDDIDSFWTNIDAGMVPQLHVKVLDPAEDGARLRAVAIDLQGVEHGRIVDLLRFMFTHKLDVCADHSLGHACSILGVAVPRGEDAQLRTRLSASTLPYRSRWRFERLDHTAPGLARLRQRMVELGFDFTARDDQAWRQALQQRSMNQPAQLREALALLEGSASLTLAG